MQAMPLRPLETNKKESEQMQCSREQANVAWALRRVSECHHAGWHDWAPSSILMATGMDVRFQTPRMLLLT
jgi:hypothetical protein